MKKFLKGIALVLVVVIACACFAGCASNEEEAIVIGGIGPTTGKNSSYGLSVQYGAQIAVDEINAAGGVNGVKLKLMFQDDQATGD